MTNSRNNQEVIHATNRAMNRLEAKIAALNMAKGPVRGKNRNRSTRVGRAETTANIPLQMSYTQRQPQGSTTHVFTFSDMIGYIPINGDTPVGQTWEFPLNPTQLSSTKLKNLSKNFEKFAFKRARFSVGVNMPTNVSGTYVVGYAENPDQAFTAGVDAPQQVYALARAVTKPYWQRADVDAVFSDRKKKYNIDFDSTETMQTTQGKFVVANVSPPTVAGSEAGVGVINVPLFMDYTVEMYGSAIQSTPDTGAPAIWPGGTFTSIGVEGTYEFVPAVGEVATPATTYQAPYLVNPAFTLTDSQQDVVLCPFIAKKVTVPTDRYCFYESLDDFNNDNFVKFPVGNVQHTVRTTIQPLN